MVLHGRGRTAEGVVRAAGRGADPCRGRVDRRGAGIPAGPGGELIAWLAWHAARGEDAQVADVAGVEQVWTAQGWADRFDLPFDRAASGYGQSTEEVGQVRASAELLLGYYDAVAQQTAAYLQRLTESDLDVVVDERWDPPVTLGVRLVSIVGDSLQHAGQASYVRGMLARARS